MSLELLKEKFSEKPIFFQYEEQIEDKEQIIEKLENETHDLSKQILTLKKEKNILLQELDKARHFEEGVFDIKEKDHSSDGNDGTFDADQPTWITAIKETDHIQGGITFIENLTTGELEDPR